MPGRLWRAPLRWPPAAPAHPAGRGVRVSAGSTPPGRVADRAIICALGWRGGDRLTLTAEAGRGDRPPRPAAAWSPCPPAPCLAIPAALRRRCGLRAGDRVLLAAVPGQDTLAAYSFAVVDQAMRAHAAVPARRGGSRDITAPEAGHPAASRQAIVDAALLLLEQMGLSPADLAAAPQDRPPVPTFAEYVPVVSAAVSAGTRRAYGSYWNRVVDHWGEPAAGRDRPRRRSGS